MAVQSIKIDSSLLFTALNSEFNDIAEDYIVEIRNGATVLDTAEVEFASALYDSGTGYAYVNLTASGGGGPVYFAVSSGTTINGITLRNGTNTKDYLIETITERVYTANGTYTVSDLIIKLGGE